MSTVVIPTSGNLEDSLFLMGSLGGLEKTALKTSKLVSRGENQGAGWFISFLGM